MSEYKLKKPRGYDVSEITKVKFGTQEVDCANLRKSAILVQTSIMVAANGEWHEIEIADLGLDSVHMPTFKHHIESNGLKLSDLGLAAEVPDYELKHDDFVQLSESFPDYDYIQITKLHEYEKRNGLPNGVYHKKQTLKYLTDQKLSITDYITQCEERKHKIISDSRNTPVVYEEVVNTEKPQQEIIVDTVPVPVPVPEDAVSITMFENLSPAKITELSALRAEQEKIAKENPVITITNATTYKEAKKVKAILLSASTKIDGKTGVFANAKRFINDFKSKFDKEGEEIAKITREPHDKQQSNIKAWEDRVLLQVQNRTKELTSIPFVYNSESDNYSIGTLIVTQKDIETLSDKDWSVLIEQAKAIKIAMDSLKSEQDAKISAQEKEIAELKAMLQQLLPNKENTAEETKDYPISEIKTPNPKSDYTFQEKVYAAVTSSETPFEPEQPATQSQSITEQIKPISGYVLASPENMLLNYFDLMHAEVLEEPGFLLKREGYIQCQKDVAKELHRIFYEIDPSIQKSKEIIKLYESWQ